MNNPATREKLQDLWKALLKAYKKSLAHNQNQVAQMNSIRLFLADNHITKPTPPQLKQLQQLHTDLAKQLDQAIQSPSCNATTLEVIRRFLTDNSITKDVATHQDMKEGLKVLSGMDIPFKH